MLQTEGWTGLDALSRQAFSDLLTTIAESGIDLITRQHNTLVETLEQSLREARRVAGAITVWENRWAQRNLVDEFPHGVSERAKRSLAYAESLSPHDYRQVLQEREIAQACHRAIADLADGIITLSCPGPAPIWTGDVPGQPLAPNPTGNFVFNAPSSLLFAPAVTMPLLSVGGLPVGVQLMGQPQQDATVTGLARWVIANIDPTIA